MQSIQEDILTPALKWFSTKNWRPFPFQQKAWRAYLQGKSGLINAPTGFGKTYALCVPALVEGLQQKNTSGLQIIWITPIRALAREIKLSFERAIEGLGMDWQVGIRSGDTSSTERSRQIKKPPQVLITTPESLHLLIATKGYPRFFRQLKAVVVDEWHELVGSKRGVMMELALSRLYGLNADLKVWGISATIGNLKESMDVLFGTTKTHREPILIRAAVHKEIDIISVVPHDIEAFPWAGHYGTKMVRRVLPIIHQSQSTLIFTNTRAMCEAWYQQLLEEDASLAGLTAMHHGSISREMRDWVEQALYDGKLKAVVATSSLDLGVDFRPVESIVQIGSPKGVARFMQRAGRSGHQPGAKSTIYFVPTHALELIEAAGLRKAIREGIVESRMPYIRSFDVLIQYVGTLAVSEGFDADQIYHEITQTFSYQSLTRDEWQWILNFVVNGGDTLQAYDEFSKVVRENGKYVIKDKRIALRHRLSIGTIVSDAAVQVKYLSGKRLGTIEEYFVSTLNAGDVFWFAGKSLEFIRMKENAAIVRRSGKKKGKIPAWMGGRMPLSSQLSQMLRLKVSEFTASTYSDRELQELLPLLSLQRKYSRVPASNEFLIEYFESREGHHLLMYPFEGRFVHEGMAALIGHRLSRIKPLSFSIAMNDYGFELLSDQPIPINEGLKKDLFSSTDLSADIFRSMNAVEIAKRRFHEIARVSGLIFQGYPGRQKRDKHLQSSTGLLFEVFRNYDPDNLLFLQTYDEAMYFQLEQVRLQAALERIRNQKIVISRPDRFTPFALPIIADSLRERLTSEKLNDRIEKMKLMLLED